MIKSIIALSALAIATVSAQGLDHISFTQPVGDGITYVAGTNQTFSWTMACTGPNRSLYSETPNATEVDFMDSNNIDNAFYVKKVGTIDCTKSVGNLVWTVPADTKPGVYALQLLLRPNNAYSGRFNVTAPGGSASGSNGGASGSNNGQAQASGNSASARSPTVVTTVAAAAAAGAAAMFMMA